MLSITEAAHELGVHPDTLKRVERTGLFIPQRTRAGARRYDAAAIEAVRALLYPVASDAPAKTGEGGHSGDGRRPKVVTMTHKIIGLAHDATHAAPQALDTKLARLRTYLESLHVESLRTVAWLVDWGNKGYFGQELPDRSHDTKEAIIVELIDEYRCIQGRLFHGYANAVLSNLV